MTEKGIAGEVLAISDDPASSQTVISDYYTANPDTDIFMTLGPNGANPFYAFMNAAGLQAGDVKHGTFASPPINTSATASPSGSQWSASIGVGRNFEVQ